MRIQDCIEVNGKSLLVLDGDMPPHGWRKLSIDGVEYDPIPAMDMGDRCVAVKGVHDLRNREVAFR